VKYLGNMKLWHYYTIQNCIAAAAVAAFLQCFDAVEGYPACNSSATTIDMSLLLAWWHKVRASDLQSSDRGFGSRSGRYQAT